MISIQSGMLVALGFLIASLLGLFVASAFWSRAVRLTTARIKQSMPVSEPEIKADRDRLRAEYAIKVHKLEMQLEQAKIERARQLIDLNRRDASISTLESDLVQLRANLEENQNARRVLEQTVSDRLPRVEARLAEAKRLLFNRDREIAELTATAKRQRQTLEEVSSVNAQKNAQIEKLSSALTTRGGRSRASGESSEGDTALRTEVEALRSKSSEQAQLIDRLQRRFGSGLALAAPASEAGNESATAKARQDISEAEAELGSARAAATSEASVALEREMQVLKARNEDQAGEIARLKAALAAFEKHEDKAGGLMESRLGLKARLSSAQAQADQQTTTITKLRSELAATHDRLARQAAHFMGEMRRIGGGSTSVAQPRRAARGEQRSLADRVAQITSASGAANRTLVSAPSDPAAPRRPEAIPANGQNGKQPDAKDKPSADEEAPTTAKTPAVVSAAAQMPQAGGISEKRRRPRLLDRITGLAKG